MMYFDIGANIGRWSLANINSVNINDEGGRIIAVEASPITFELLRSNLNEYNNNTANTANTANIPPQYKNEIIPLNYAVCNNAGEDILFYNSTQENTISTINKEWLTDEKSRFCGIQYTEIWCKTITIDDLIEQYGVPYLIKIDVEGGEYETIMSLNRKIDTVCFEWACELKDVAFKCMDHLSTIGFTHFYLQYEDNYLFRPNIMVYNDIFTVKDQINTYAIPKIHWGMIWAR